MTGPAAVLQVPPIDPSLPAPLGRSDGAPVSPEEFVRLLAQLLRGAGAATADPPAQKIGEGPAELEREPSRKAGTPDAEQAAPDALAALAVELIPVAPPPPSPAQDSGPGSAQEAAPAAAEAPKALTPPAMGEVSPAAVKSLAAPPAPPERRDLPATASAAPPAPKPVTSSSRPSADAAPPAVPPPARQEEPRPPAAGPHAMQTAPEARLEVTPAIGPGDAGGFHSSPDGDRATDRGRDDAEARYGIGGVSGAPASTAQPAADPADGSARPSPAPAPRAAVEQVAERVGLAHREGRGEVSFRLEPPELGAVRIQAVLEGQQLTLHIRTEHDAARAALEQSMPQLRESLAQQGIVAGRVTIELGLDTSAREFSGQGFTGSPRQEPVEPPAQVNASAVRGPWREPDGRGFDLWV